MDTLTITPSAIAAILWIIAVVAYGAVFQRQRRRKHHLGGGAAGSIYDMLNEDKRKAVEIIAEHKAEATDPETRDEIVPPLE